MKKEDINFLAEVANYIHTDYEISKDMQHYYQMIVDESDKKYNKDGDLIITVPKNVLKRFNDGSVIINKKIGWDLGEFYSSQYFPHLHSMIVDHAGLSLLPDKLFEACAKITSLDIYDILSSDTLMVPDYETNEPDVWISTPINEINIYSDDKYNLIFVINGEEYYSTHYYSYWKVSKNGEDALRSSRFKEFMNLVDIYKKGVRKNEKNEDEK